MSGLIIVRLPRWRPSKKLTYWIRAHKIQRVAMEINVTRTTVYSWLAGTSAPLGDNARALRELSIRCPEGIGPLSLDDIFGPSEG